MADSETEPRLTLRTLAGPQKALVLVIVLAVGLGYLSALANLFGATAGKDGTQTIRLGEFYQVLRSEGPFVLMTRITESLGLGDVIATYHGSDRTGLVAALEGSMREKVADYYGDATEDEADHSESLRQMLIAWSQLPNREWRQVAYAEGIPVDEQGVGDIEKFVAIREGRIDGSDAETETAVALVIQEACSYCHNPNGDAQAKHYPLTTFEEIDRFNERDRGMPIERLALHTHVHLLGFSVLFAMTGFLFSLTELPLWIRLVGSPATLALQVVEISCWWLAKVHVVFAVGILLLGPLVGLSLLIQLCGITLDTLRSPVKPDDDDLL